MRILNFNILNGGEGRADPLAEIILAQHADVVALVEADDEDVLRRIARRLEMDYIHAPGTKHSAALLSRFAIMNTVNHALLRPDGPRSFLEARVRFPDGDVTIGVIHLSAHARESDEDQRMTELRSVLDVFEACRREGRPHLLAGDFNSNSPHQRIDPARCKPSTREEWDLNGGQLPRRVVQALLDAGYVDTLHALHPLESQTLGSFSTQRPGQRVDYIFSHGLRHSHLKAAWIEQDRLAKYASDHFPVGAEISLPQARA